MYKAVVLLLLIGVPLARGRDLKIGRISGQVVSREGEPVANAQVTAALQTGGPTVRADRLGMTDELPAMSIGRIAITTTAPR